MIRKDMLIAALLEGLLLVVAAAAGWVTRQPLIFASLGPTAYEMIETPKRRTARPYNIFFGHLTGVMSAFFALWVTGAWSAPVVSRHGVPFIRIWAVMLAAVLTVFFTLLIRAAQPAAVATALLIAIGAMQSKSDGLMILAAVVLTMAAGEPLRRWRARAMPEGQGG
jgi:CBS domain-containing membrane protein